MNVLAVPSHLPAVPGKHWTCDIETLKPVDHGGGQNPVILRERSQTGCDTSVAIRQIRRDYYTVAILLFRDLNVTGPIFSLLGFRAQRGIIRKMQFLTVILVVVFAVAVAEILVRAVADFNVAPPEETVMQSQSNKRHTAPHDPFFSGLCGAFFVVQMSVPGNPTHVPD